MMIKLNTSNKDYLQIIKICYNKLVQYRTKSHKDTVMINLKPEPKVINSKTQRNFSIIVLLATVAALTACSTTASQHSETVTTIIKPTVIKPNYKVADFEVISSEEIKRLNDEYNNTVRLSIDGKRTNQLSLNGFKQGLHERTLLIQVPVGDTSFKDLTEKKLRIYRQPNSVVISMDVKESIGNTNKQYQPAIVTDNPATQIAHIDGKHIQNLPSIGTYAYKGIAFDNKNTGEFNYLVNFNTLMGQGDYTLNGKRTTLPQGTVGQWSKKDGSYYYGVGSSDSNNQYKLFFFDDEAEEIAGGTKDGVGLAGVKQ